MIQRANCSEILIAFDTSTEAIALGAAFDVDRASLGACAADFPALDEAIIHTDSIAAKRCANTRLLPSVDEMASAKGIAREDVVAIVCGRGPGSFTGVRIGVATAKGAATGLGCALYGVPTLDAIAWEAWLAGYRGALGVVGDALRKEVYPVRYDLREEVAVRLNPDMVDKPAAASARWAAEFAARGDAIMLAGDGLAKFLDTFEGAFAEAGAKCEVLPEERWAVTGRGLLMAYYEMKRRGALGGGHPQELQPVYTRLSDAEENEKIRLETTGAPMPGVLVGNPEFDVRASGDGKLHPSEAANLPTNADAFAASSSADIPSSGVGEQAQLHYRRGGIARDAAPEATELGLRKPLILAIETSCDETAAAIIDSERTMIADLVATQVDFHARFGGVVPEIASRKHTEAIVGVVDETMDRAGEALGLNRSLDFSELDAIAVTQGPGLVGALVVGLAFAKGLSWATKLPLIGVNHLEGHIYANRIANPAIEPPMVVSLVSGGHTMLVHVKDWGDYEILGQTLDDAVGEAFDKVAKALGLGYPGGPVISRLAAKGNPDAIDFPRAMLHSHDFRFSLSGLKTAVMTYIKDELAAGRELNMPNIAASFQRAVVDVQVAKALAAVEETDVDEFCLGGGVAANPELRKSLAEAIGAHGVHVTLPELSACTDNAGMIAAVAIDLWRKGEFLDLTADSLPNMEL
ncbi:MAG: tRNA (adenosine(37)-N6)-threonylcarbamoyltransferase complex transferase subunit TsaD [bacterium]|nr:tRNA (adenosine(37)-N6)-threonylcarbamoyltransferase complex transferase subunit TsaD [bacterium]